MKEIILTLKIVNIAHFILEKKNFIEVNNLPPSHSVPSIFFCHTKALHVFLHSIPKHHLRSSSFYPAWTGWPGSSVFPISLSDTSTIPPLHMSKLSNFELKKKG